MKAALGSGVRFALLRGKLAKQPGVSNSAVLSAATAIGRKKYGFAKFSQLSKAHRKS